VFALAADIGGPGAARYHAAAGIALVSFDPDAARSHLERAREGGEILLADVGLAELDAITERRWWAGPSAPAIDVLLALGDW
jgi:hypothetical protein